MRYALTIGTAILMTTCLWAQKPVVKGWHLLDKTDDGYFGISLEKAYRYLAGKAGHEVVVAVLDGGIDTTHEDLRSVLWHNPKEIQGNQVDDDHNGFTDDLLGWNFLGSPDGKNVEKESLEVARLYYELKPKYEGRQPDTSSMHGEEKQQYLLWKQVNKAIEVSQEDRFMLKVVRATFKAMGIYDSVIRAEWKVPEYSAIDLEKYHPGSPEGKKAKLGYLRVVELLQFDPEQTNVELFEEVNEFITQKDDLLALSERNEPVINYRLTITGDDDNNLDTRSYGNADVMGPASLHGTHVAGIIGAVRQNGLGVDGIADKVKIMAVRMVPRGDEHDKDVALGIRYAVDNGAKVINMSFGKEVSPHKKWVDEAIKYAAQKDVLLVHAAGNDGIDLDAGDQYPSPILYDNTLAPNMIRVGASGDSSLKGGMVADFTNYGNKRVDILAPGVKIYSTAPTGNGYNFQQGTSMAAPVVSGIAALIRSYFPNLSAVEVKQVIEQSADTSLRNQYFPQPGSEKRALLPMSSLSRAGGIVNAYNAVRLADEWSRKKKAAR